MNKRIIERILPREQWGVSIELALVVVFAILVGRQYLVFDLDVWPVGGDFSLTVQPYFNWNLLTKCGICVLWNGSLNGGTPAFVELHSAVLHPVVIVTTLIWGAINGAKVTLIVSLVLAGIAQWWLARVMNLGLVPRLWAAGLAVTGGYLAGRMEIGLIGVVLSTATASLVIAPGLALAKTGERRAMILFALALALTFLSGQGYTQIGVLLGILPAYLVLLVDKNLRVNPNWKKFLAASGIALLLTGIFWVPLSHFYPYFAKYIDIELSGGQPLEYLPLNFIIRDFQFYLNETLGKINFPAVYMNYIGWIPLLFAFYAFRRATGKQTRLLAFFLIAITLIFLLGSSEVIKFVAQRLVGSIAAVRYPALITALAAPFLLGLAAWGLDFLLTRKWPEFKLEFHSGSTIGVKSVWIVVVPLLLISLISTYDFSQDWHRTAKVAPEVFQVMPVFRTETTQWVSPPDDEYFWIPVMLGRGLKVTNVFRPWYWKYREPPPPHIGEFVTSVENTNIKLLGDAGPFTFVRHPANEYAFVDTGSSEIPCRAQALGGHISVDCETDVAGTLIVRENQWSGWRAYRDGKRVALGPGSWLQAAAPAGQHHYEFRYRPWDVLLGSLLTLVGIVLVVWLWLKPPAWFEKVGINNDEN